MTTHGDLRRQSGTEGGKHGEFATLPGRHASGYTLRQMSNEIAFMNRYAWSLCSTLAVLTLSACRPVTPPLSPADSSRSGMAPLTADATVTLTQEEAVRLDEIAPSPLVMQAMKDLARRLALPLDAITVESVEAVTWRDSSLGCPQPGMAARPVLQAGSRIRLVAAGQIYAYHSGGSRAPFLCEHPADDSVAPAPNLDN